MLKPIQILSSRKQKQTGVDIKARQQILIESYKHNPQAATVLDFACTDSAQWPADDALHSKVLIDRQHKVEQVVSVHRAVGGDSDAPTPGDILCGAIASCLDTTIRVIANRFGLKLKTLKVAVTGRVDVRGTLRASRQVPVHFQAFDVEVSIAMQSIMNNVWIDRLLKGAEQSCIVIQTLNQACDITIRRATQNK